MIAAPTDEEADYLASSTYQRVLGILTGCAGGCSPGGELHGRAAATKSVPPLPTSSPLAWWVARVPCAAACTPWPKRPRRTSSCSSGDVYDPAIAPALAQYRRPGFARLKARSAAGQAVAPRPASPSAARSATWPAPPIHPRPRTVCMPAFSFDALDAQASPARAPSRPTPPALHAACCAPRRWCRWPSTAGRPPAPLRAGAQLERAAAHPRAVFNATSLAVDAPARRPGGFGPATGARPGRAGRRGPKTSASTTWWLRCAPR